MTSVRLDNDVIWWIILIMVRSAIAEVETDRSFINISLYLISYFT